MIRAIRGWAMGQPETPRLENPIIDAFNPESFPIEPGGPVDRASFLHCLWSFLGAPCSPLDARDRQAVLAHRLRRGPSGLGGASPGHDHRPGAPRGKKWATVIRITNPEERPAFTTHHYRESKHAVDFWPASTIKLYAVVAVLEWLNRESIPLETTLTYSHQDPAGVWITDCARTVPEMVSEVFRRSSNEDYTLLLRTLGIDGINTRFLVPGKGFPHSALMRDYVTHRPVVYENHEPQRVHATLSGDRSRVFEHRWSGRSYSQERGATALSATTGNCTSTHELADCLRRILFHSSLPPEERFAITAVQARWISNGDPARGVVGLENRLAGPFAWEDAGERVFPNARYWHKAGQISSFVLDLCSLSDADSNHHLILALAARSGDPQVIRDLARHLFLAAKSGLF